LAVTGGWPGIEGGVPSPEKRVPGDVRGMKSKSVARCHDRAHSAGQDAQLYGRPKADRYACGAEQSG